jgi:hypothetical protein
MLLHSNDHSETDYHSSRGITYHRLMDFVNLGPRYYYRRHVTGDHGSAETRDWQDLGRAYHTFALEGEEAFRAKVISTPETYPATPKKKDDPIEQKPWNMGANFCKDWVAGQKDKIVLSPSEYAQAEAIGRNMRADPHAARMLQVGWPEITVIQTENAQFPVPLKCRIDWLAATSTDLNSAWAIVDPKGTASFNSFKKDAISYNYNRQLAWYQWLIHQEIGKRLPCFLVAVEKEHSHRVRVWQVSQDYLDVGHDENTRDLERLRVCYQSNQWPLDHESRIDVLDTPAWKKPKAEADDGAVAPWDEVLP